MGKTLTIGPITAQTGTKVNGYLPVLTRPDGTVLGIPLTVVNGKKDGPVLYLNGGTHGDEFEAAMAIIEVMRDLTPESLSGAVIGAPMVNVAAMIEHVSADVSSMRENPIDSRELMSAFPGDIKGTVTDRLAYTITECLFANSDYALDLHAGGDRGTSVNLAGFIDAEGDYGRKSFEIAKCYPMELLWKLPMGKMAKAAHDKGCVVCMGEVRGEGRARGEDVKTYVTAITNVLKYLGMIEGELKDIPSKRRCVEAETYLYVKEGSGFLKALKVEGQEMSRGEVLGSVVDVFGNELETVVAPFDGIVTGVRTKAVIWPGEVAFLVSRFVEEGTYWPKKGTLN